MPLPSGLRINLLGDEAVVPTPLIVPLPTRLGVREAQQVSRHRSISTTAVIITHATDISLKR